MSVRDDLHKLIDDYFNGIGGPLVGDVGPLPMTDSKPHADVTEADIVATTPDPPKLAEPKVIGDTRVVRTKSSGDKVYLVNDKEMTKRWIPSPAVLDGLGFTMADVQDMSDLDFLKYKQQSVTST